MKFSPKAFDELGIDISSMMLGDDRNKNSIWVISFEEHAVPRFYEQFTRLEQDPNVSVITIYISSYGGDVYSLIAMRDLIKTATKPVATIAVGKAMSAGMFLLAAGTKGLRFASQNTQILIHEVQSVSIEGSSTEISRHAQETQKTTDQLFKRLKEDVGPEKFKLIDQAMKKAPGVDLFVDAKTAMDWGVIDRIDIPRVASSNPQSGLLMESLPETKPVKRKKTKR